MSLAVLEVDDPATTSRLILVAPWAALAARYEPDATNMISTPESFI